MAKKRKYYSNSSKDKVKKTVSISALLAAELDRAKSDALAAGLGKFNLSEWFAEQLELLIKEMDADVSEKTKGADKNAVGDNDGDDLK